MSPSQVTKAEMFIPEDEASSPWEAFGMDCALICAAGADAETTFGSHDP